jgi:hypothetical protein
LNRFFITDRQLNQTFAPYVSGSLRAAGERTHTSPTSDLASPPI